MYWTDRSTPSDVLVEAETTNWTAAFWAATPAHSTSRVASNCSDWLADTPGLVPFTMMVGSLAGRPNVLRNPCTSERLMLLRPATAIDWPVPSVEDVYSGATS